MRMVILGNSGSGKTWLARALAQHAAVPVIHLDELFWEPGGFDRKRSAETIDSLVAKGRAGSSWIVEGVFGDLAAKFLEDADALVWLDLSWPVCEARLLQRGCESKQHMDRAQSEQGLKNLLAWACEYYTRKDLRSREGHQLLFSNFPRKKERLEDGPAVMEFVNRFLQIVCASR